VAVAYCHRVLMVLAYLWVWEVVVLVYQHGGWCFMQICGLGISSAGIPPQTGGGSSKPVDEGDLQYAAFMVDRLHLAQTKCLECQNEA
jgi:hypothetical protein